MNGLFIILGLWLDPVYAACRRALRIDESSRLWQAFQTLRTFVLVTFIKVLPEVGTLSDGWGLWKRIFTDHELPRTLRRLLPFLDWSSLFTLSHFAMAMLGTACLFCFSLIERRRPVRSITEKWPMPLRAAALGALFFLIFTFGIQNSWEGGGFLYAQF